MGKRIQLTRGKYTLVDEDDFDWLSQWKWRYNGKYAEASYAEKDGVVFERILMHRLILQPPEGLQTDHKNLDKLDNRKENLRACSISQNSANKAKCTWGKNKYKGVRKRTNAFGWYARIKKDGKFIYLGRFEKEDDAASAYNNAAIKYFGEFARINEIATGEQP